MIESEMVRRTYDILVMYTCKQEDQIRLEERRDEGG